MELLLIVILDKFHSYFRNYVETNTIINKHFFETSNIIHIIY